MKLFIIAIFIAFGTICTNSLIAEDCDYPYCGPWTPEYPTYLDAEITGYGNCTYEIYYKTRECIIGNDTIRQIRIDRLEIYPDIDVFPDKDVLLRHSIEVLLFWSWWYFDIANPLNEYNVSFLVPACMKGDTVWLPDNGPKRFRIEDCGDECCSATYTLQVVDDKMYIRDSDYGSGNDGITCIAGPQQLCEKVCSNLTFSDNHEIDMSYILPCDYPCPTVDFNPQPKLYSHTLGSGETACTFGIGYGIRECENLDEISISHIGPITGNKTYWGLDDFLNGAIQELLGNVEEIFNLTPPCTVVVRTHSCWTSPDEFSSMYPCGNASCCSSTYELLELGGTIYSSTISHDPGDIQICAQNCTNICSAHLMLNEDVPEQFPTIIEELNKSLNEEQIKIIPHPASGNTEMIFTDAVVGDAEILIYNSLGKQVYSTTYRKDFQLIKFNINLSNMSDGIYYLRIKVNGELKCNRSFILQK